MSFDESDDEDYPIIYGKNSFSYKIISVEDLKTDSENDNVKVDMPSFLSSLPTVSYYDDFDYFKNFEKEFPAIAYNDALTSKLDFSEPTGIKREFSVARTPQQNGVAERKNRTLIEAARTMLADSLLPTTFWAEAISTACYVQNRVLVTKPHNKTPIARIRSFTPPASLVTAGNQTNKNAGIKDNVDAVPTQQYILLPLLYDSPQSSEDAVTDDGKKNGVLDPAKEDDKSGQGEATNTNNTNRLNNVSSSINTVSSSFTSMDPRRERAQRNEFESVFRQDKDANGNNIYRMSTLVNADGSSCDNLGGSIPVNAATFPNADLPTNHLMHKDTTDLLNIGIFSGAYDDEDVGAEADLNNLETTMNNPKKVTQALTDPSWIEAMQDEFLQFRLQKVWRLVDLPKGKHAIGTK
ncbi:putative ribonuclease H-like domain-containing protein [Tanacetum coccineum]